MTDSPTRRPRVRATTARSLVVAAALLLISAVIPAGLASAHDYKTWTVSPGQSIQDAVDQASSGDVISLEAGTYANQAVCVVGKGLTIVGAGRDETKITWPQWTTPDVFDADGNLVTAGDQADAPAAGNACWQDWASHDPESVGDPATQHGLADDVSALFFLHPDSAVTVSGLTTVNHPANGVVTEYGNGFSVTETRGVAHDRYGILASATTNTLIKDNSEIGKDRGTADAPNSGTAGIGVSDTPSANALVKDNYSQGWNLGVFVREARTGAVVGNTVTGNCVGFNFFDDTNTEVPPNPASTIPAGAWAVIGNKSVDNHRFCLAGIGQVQAALRVSGTGMDVVNMDSVLIKDNVIKNNSPRSDIDPTSLQFPPGGLTLLTLAAFNTTTPNAAGPISKIGVIGNTITGNVPWDILMGPPPGATLENSGLSPVTEQDNQIVFDGNTCGISFPPGTADCG
jgi:hypothetical protein